MLCRQTQQLLPLKKQMASTGTVDPLQNLLVFTPHLSAFTMTLSALPSLLEPRNHINSQPRPLWLQEFKCQSTLMQLTPTTMLLLGASPSSSVIAHHQPDTITGLHCHVPDQGRQCSHRRAYWHRAPAVACGLRSGLVFCPWHEACTHLQLAPPIVHLPSSTPVTGLHCHAPMWDPVAIVVHADRQGPHNCQCNCSWPWLLLPVLAATTICLQPAPTTTLSLVASLWSWVCIHHWLWPLPLLALIPTC